MITQQLGPRPHITLGCDPEFFFQCKGKVIGSEKVLGIESGLGQGSSSQCIVDGVQVEINPQQSTCREILANNIHYCFERLHEKLQQDKSIKMCFAQTVKIEKEELDTLSEKSKKLGCSPSLNVNKEDSGSISVNPETYLYRSAGGHIHLGKCDRDARNNEVYQRPERLVAILDILVGNTCVLIDRDPGNKIRRQVYGRAGEYRLPSHGLEYRTLSNFWLRSYPLMSFVMNMCRMSVALIAQSTPECDYEKELLSLVNMENIRKAINENDFNLAMQNFQAIKQFIMDIVPVGDEVYPLHKENMQAFEFFVKKGVDYWFAKNPIPAWLKYNQGSTHGWERFMKTSVTTKMNRWHVVMDKIKAFTKEAMRE